MTTPHPEAPPEGPDFDDPDVDPIGPDDPNDPDVETVTHLDDPDTEAIIDEGADTDPAPPLT